MNQDLYEYNGNLYNQINIQIINDADYNSLYDFAIVGYSYGDFESECLAHSEKNYEILDDCLDEAKRIFCSIMKKCRLVSWDWRSGEFK